MELDSIDAITSDSGDGVPAPATAPAVPADAAEADATSIPQTDKPVQLTYRFAIEIEVRTSPPADIEPIVREVFKRLTQTCRGMQ